MVTKRVLEMKEKRPIFGLGEGFFCIRYLLDGLNFAS